MKKFFAVIVAYLSAHPALKNLVEGFLHVIIGAVGAYVMMTLAPGHTQAFAWAGLGYACLGAAKAFSQNQHDLIVAFLQDQLQAIVNNPTLSAAQVVKVTPAPTSSALTPVPVVPAVVPPPSASGVKP